jgi:hypothetical protein
MFIIVPQETNYLNFGIVWALRFNVENLVAECQVTKQHIIETTKYPKIEQKIRTKVRTKNSNKKFEQKNSNKFPIDRINEKEPRPVTSRRKKGSCLKPQSMPGHYV